MLQLHLPSSSPVKPQYSIKLCPNHAFSPKFLSFSGAFKPSGSSFSLILPASRRKALSVKCRQSDFFDQKTIKSAGAGGRASGGVGALPPRVYVGHSIYKGKAALTMTPRPPEFTPLDGHLKYLGKVMCYYSLLQRLACANMTGTENRYFLYQLVKWEVISLGVRGSCEFFHDPFKGKSDEGKVRKVLKVEPLPDGSGHFFNLSVQNTLVNVDESIYIPVTKAELAIFTSIFNFITPYLLGWHAFANSIIPESPSQVNDANPRYGGDYEWKR